MKRKYHKNEFNPGFTLIELLVVIAIIGTLSALLIVAIGKMRINAQAGEIISNYREVKIAFEAWMIDANKDMHPHESWYGALA